MHPQKPTHPTMYNAPGLGGHGRAPRLGREHAIPHLLRLLHDERPTIRMRAAAALGGVAVSYPHRAPEITAALLRHLGTEPTQTAQVAAVMALGTIGEQLPTQRTTVTGHLLGWLEQPGVFYIVRMAVCDALGVCCPHVDDALLRERAVLALAAALDDTHDGVQEAAVLALVRLGEQATGAVHARIVRALVGVLREGHPQVAMGAAWGLGHLQAAEAVPALITALDDTTMPAITRFSHIFQPYGGQRICDAAALALACIDTHAARAALREWEAAEEHHDA